MRSGNAGPGLWPVGRDFNQRSLQGDRLGGDPRSCAPAKPGLRRLGLSLGLAVLAAAPVEAGAWPQGKGEALLITTALYDRADGFWDDGRERRDEGYFYKDEIALYGEYGLTDRITLVGRTAWQTIEQVSADGYDSARGLAASELGIRRLFWSDDRDVFSLQAGMLIPGPGENVTNQPLGEGERAYELRALLGRGLEGNSFWDVQLAHRWRGGRDLDEARLDLTYGFEPVAHWQVLAQSFSVWSAEGERPGAPEFDQHKLQVSVRRAWGEVDIQAGAFFTPSGRNALDERALFLSVWRRF